MQLLQLLCAAARLTASISRVDGCSTACLQISNMVEKNFASCSTSRCCRCRSAAHYHAGSRLLQPTSENRSGTNILSIRAARARQACKHGFVIKKRRSLEALLWSSVEVLGSPVKCHRAQLALLLALPSGGKSGQAARHGAG